MLAFLVSAALLTQQGERQFSIFDILNPKSDVVATAKGAYALLPPVLVDSQNIGQCAWSTDGAYLLYQKIDYRAEVDSNLELIAPPNDALQGIYFWNARTHKSSLALTIQTRQEDVQD